MRRRTDIPSQSDVTEHVDRDTEHMEETEIDLEKITADIENVRETLRTLDLGGTQEGSDQVAERMEDADNVAHDEFDQRDEELEQAQGEAEEYQDEMTGRSDTADADAEKISVESTKIEFEGAVSQMSYARDAALRDVEFLAEQTKRAQEAIEKCKRAEEQAKERVKKEA